VTRGVRGGPDDATLDDSAEELYEDAPCGYLTTSPDGTIRRANRTFLGLSGYAVDEVVGHRFYDLLPPGAQIYYETHYAPLLQMQGSVREIALELLRADGGRMPVLVNAVAKHDEQGRPRSVRITVFDASDRRRYERELLAARGEAEARAAAATALEHVAEGVVLLDADDRIALLNPAAERILGVAIQEARGLPLTAVAPGWGAVQPRIPVLRRDGRPARPVVVPLTVGGAVRWLAASGEPAPEGVVYTFRDVTDERRLEDLRDDIVATVSHELRTPLAGVYGAAQTLLSRGEELEPEQRRGLAELLVDQSGRLTRVVEQIDLARRLDQGEVAPRRAAVDVAALVDGLVQQAREWRKTGPIATAVPSGLEAEGDPELLEQVLVALVDNAIAYGPPGGEVRIEATRTGGSVRVLVADEGPGVPEADRERIFDRFVRLDPTQTTGTSGTGLGLYIARELVRRMHGRIELLPGERGASFFVELPAPPGR
jgi:PAS domain S-box-containing protein